MSSRQKPFCTVGPHCRVHQEVYRDISVLLFRVVCPQGTNHNLTLANGKNMPQLKWLNCFKKIKIWRIRLTISGLNYQGFLGSWKMRACCLLLIGTLGSNDADGNEKVIKTIGNKQNNNFARASLTLFLYISFPFCTTTTWKCLISCFMENVNKQRRNFISVSELKYGPLKFSFRRVRLQLTK